MGGEVPSSEAGDELRAACRDDSEGFGHPPSRRDAEPMVMSGSAREGRSESVRAVSAGILCPGCERPFTPNRRNRRGRRPDVAYHFGEDDFALTLHSEALVPRPS